MRYRKKPSVIEATQWFRNGDHPKDMSTPIDSASEHGTSLTEGEVVKFFRRLNIPGNRVCPDCGNVMHKHGILVGVNGEEEVVHPGDYIVTQKTHGHFYRRSAVEFEAMYEEFYEELEGEVQLTESEFPDISELVKRIEALEDHFTGPANSDPASARIVPREEIFEHDTTETIEPAPTIADPGKLQ